MAIRLERTIWPVGHGAFYTEQFKDGDNVLFTAVYDCGSYQKRTLRHCIDEFVQNSGAKQINALFISHFHFDHVNALDYLLSKIYVENLFIPQLTDDYILSILGTCTYIRAAGDQIAALDVLRRLYSGNGLDNVGHIYEVPQVNEDNLQEENYREQDYQGSYKYEKAPLIYSPNPIWEYIPCNIFAHNKSLVDKFIDNGFGDWNGNVDINRVFDELLKGNWSNLQAFYDEVFPHGHNEYSMTVYSGFSPKVTVKGITANVNIFPMVSYKGVDLNQQNITTVLSEDIGCIYTGDFEAQRHVQELKQFYCQNHGVWRRAITLQIPHHGSYNNFVDDLYDFRKLTFLSSAVRDRDHHPHLQTIIGITSKSCPVVIVRDDKIEALIIIYSIVID